MTPAKTSAFYIELDPGAPIREQPRPFAVIGRGPTLRKHTQPLVNRSAVPLR